MTLEFWRCSMTQDSRIDIVRQMGVFCCPPQERLATALCPSHGALRWAKITRNASGGHAANAAPKVTRVHAEVRPTCSRRSVGRSRPGLIQERGWAAAAALAQAPTGSAYYPHTQPSPTRAPLRGHRRRLRWSLRGGRPLCQPLAANGAHSDTISSQVCPGAQHACGLGMPPRFRVWQWLCASQ